MKSKIYLNKTLKNALFLVLVTIFLMSCGGGAGTDTTDSTDSTATESTTGTTENTPTAPVEIEDPSGKITDAAVAQACDCLQGAKKEDGSVDVPKMRECMGGKTSVEVVDELLGPEASDKERSDAYKVFKAKVEAKCP